MDEKLVVYVTVDGNDRKYNCLISGSIKDMRLVYSLSKATVFTSMIDALDAICIFKKRIGHMLNRFDFDIASL